MAFQTLYQLLLLYADKWMLHLSHSHSKMLRCWITLAHDCIRVTLDVPGPSGEALHRWGHMRVRALLSEAGLDPCFRDSPLIAQFSSLGSWSSNQLEDLCTSFCAGTPPGEDHPACFQDGLFLPCCSHLLEAHVCPLPQATC